MGQQSPWMQNRPQHQEYCSRPPNPSLFPPARARRSTISRVGELELTHIFTGHTRNDQNRTRLEASRHPVNIILAAAKECQLCDTSGHMASARIIGIVHSGDDT